MSRWVYGAGKQRFTKTVYNAQSAVASAVANPHRLELLDLLSQRSRTVQDVAAEAHLSVANASQHLQILARCGLVSVERHGVFALYRTVGPTVSRLLLSIREVAEAGDRLASAVAPYFGSREPGIVDIAVVRALVEDPRVTLLDVRAPEEYEAGHFPGAINAPLAVLKDGTLKLVRGKRYFLYCRGPYFILADEAIELLRERGFRATRLALGPADWEAYGGKLDRSRSDRAVRDGSRSPHRRAKD